MKNTTHLQKIYGIIGRILCTVAGGIVGFVVGGFIVAILGVVVGYLVGTMLEKATLRILKTKNT